MIFIVGGAFSGKRGYAEKSLGAADLAEGTESFDRLCKADAALRANTALCFQKAELTCLPKRSG